ncbi:hypothetical protein RRG08_013568 [Elysia crispata]|uniref:ABC transmembrane type-1 domain-containing protein n=1 Tax=Elysia crispata TaxID=231223 RepID=A0AAE1CQK9_9GAST|nr:hypothetical protein RRG08_013568 [Elysia crispata]
MRGSASSEPEISAVQPDRASRGDVGAGDQAASSSASDCDPAMEQTITAPTCQEDDVDDSEMYLQVQPLTDDELGFKPAPRKGKNSGWRRYRRGLRSAIPFRTAKPPKDTLPLGTNGLVNYMTFGWLTTYMLTVFRKGTAPLTTLQMSEQEGAEVNARRMGKFWSEEVAERGETDASYGRAIFKSFKTRILIGAVLSFLHAGLLLANPIFVIRYFLAYLSEDDAVSVSGGLVFALSLAVVILLRGLVNALFWMLNLEAAARIKYGTLALLYAKILKLKSVGDKTVGDHCLEHHHYHRLPLQPPPQPTPVSSALPRASPLSPSTTTTTTTTNTCIFSTASSITTITVYHYNHHHNQHLYLQHCLEHHHYHRLPLQPPPQPTPVSSALPRASPLSPSTTTTTTTTNTCIFSTASSITATTVYRYNHQHNQHLCKQPPSPPKSLTKTTTCIFSTASSITAIAIYRYIQQTPPPPVSSPLPHAPPLSPTTATTLPSLHTPSSTTTTTTTTCIFTTTPCTTIITHYRHHSSIATHTIIYHNNHNHHLYLHHYPMHHHYHPLPPPL